MAHDDVLRLEGDAGSSGGSAAWETGGFTLDGETVPGTGASGGAETRLRGPNLDERLGRLVRMLDH